MISPILLIIQINRIHSPHLEIQIICYVDDIVMLCETDWWEEILEIIKRDIKLLKQ